MAFIFLSFLCFSTLPFPFPCFLFFSFISFFHFTTNDVLFVSFATYPFLVYTSASKAIGDIALAAVYGRGMMYHLLSQMAEIYQIKIELHGQRFQTNSEICSFCYWIGSLFFYERLNCSIPSFLETE